MKAGTESSPGAVGTAQFGSEYAIVDPTLLTPVVQGFQELVKEGSLKPRVFSFSEIRQHGARDPKKTTTQNCIDVVEEAIADRPTGQLYVDGDEAAEKLENRTQGVRLSRTSVAETSAHKVFFATLTGGAGRIRVAVKPFMEGAVASPGVGANTGSLAAEWVNTLLAREHGFGAFTPLGFVVTSGGGYMLTERREGIDSMDNTDWTEVLQNPDAHVDTLNDLRKIGPLLARLHDEGGFHQDTQLKNFVLTEAGELDLIDWEAAKWVEPPVWGLTTGPEMEEYLRGRTSRDLTVLFASLARSVADKGVGFLDGLLPDVQWAVFDEYILTPYINERLRLSNMGDHLAHEQIVLHLGELETELRTYVLNREMYNTLARARQRH